MIFAKVCLNNRCRKKISKEISSERVLWQT